MKHLLHALDTRRHKLSLPDAELDQLLAEIKDARDVKGSEQFTDSLEKVLSDLRSLSEAHAFLKPVTKSDAPDYHAVIKQPMDLGTMGRKVRGKQYKTKSEFVADLNLIWDNCLTYNATVTHPLRRCAILLRKRTAILAELIHDPSERSAPFTLRSKSAGGLLRRRSVIDDSDDDYSSASGKFNGTKPRMNGVAKMDGVIHTNGRVNGINGTNGRASSTPESDVPARQPLQRPRGSLAPIPRPKTPLAERTPITRSVESMNQFLSLDNELSQFEDGLQTAGAGPSRLGSTSLIDDEFFRTQSIQRARTQLRQLRQNDDTVQRLDEPSEARVQPGAKRKRSNMVLTSSDEESDDKKPTQRTKFSTTGVPPELEESQDNVDLWWEAMRSGNMVGNGLLPMAQYGFPPLQPNKARRRKKRQKNDARTGLSGTIYKNISTLHNIRRVHSKILILNAVSEDPNLYLPPMAMEQDEPEPPRPTIPGLTQGEDFGAQCLHRVSSTVLEHAGFEGSSEVSLNVLQHVASDYIMNVGRTFRFMVDKFGHTMSNEQIILHCLAEHGISEVQDLERYVKDDVERYGSRLQDLERKLTQAYAEQTEAAAIEEDGLFDEDNEEFALGGFTDDLGEDFFGLRELGLERELGLTTLAVPKRLLRGRRDNAANANSANREPPLPYPPPTTFIPIHTANLDSHIGLLHPYYGSRAGPPAADGTNPAGVILQDDPINALKVKMGPLGQIVPVAANSGKKKGGGGGGTGGGGGGNSAAAAGGSGPADSGVVKLESGAPKDHKKKKAKAPAAPAPSSSNELPLTMPTFGAATKSSATPAPPPEVSTMMPDFNAFVSGVHAGV